jgi:hypothetical protein
MVVPMSELLDQGPFAPRDDSLFLREMNALSRWHLDHCPEYRRVWSDWHDAHSAAELPYLHAGLFKHVTLQTQAEGIKHLRVLLSSSTSGGQPSRIALDERSSMLQERSTRSILAEFVGSSPRPLVVVDDPRALRRRGEVSARIAAAMVLRPLATEIQFLLADSDPVVPRWDVLLDVLARSQELLVYGFTSILWQAWLAAELPASVRGALAGKTIHFVHSGGWKKLEAARIDRRQFDAGLLVGLSDRSRVLDYYGLVEQVGVIFPYCEHGFHHAPRWADVIVRDPWTLAALPDQPGLLQLLNVLAHGAPYHSVLTEDFGRLAPGPCPCGRSGRRLELIGRVPRAELRGCANV